MKQITEWCKTKEELQFAIDQIEKYGGETTIKSKEKDNETMYCVMRIK